MAAASASPAHGILAMCPDTSAFLLSSWQGTLLREVTGSGRVKEASIKIRNLISDVNDSPLSHYRHRKCIKVTFIDAISRKKPTLFYTDTLRGFRAQGCASDRHKAPRSSLEEARWGDWRLIGAQARSRKRSTSGRVKMGSACPGVCAEPPK